MKIAMVCSAGGHLSQLLLLAPEWGRHELLWVTLDKADARSKLANEKVYFAHGPTNRSLPMAVRNFRLAGRILRDERPDVIVSNGAGVAVPFFMQARILGIPSVFLEVYDRIDRPSLSGALVAPLATTIVAQWPSQIAAYPNAVLLGSML